MPPDPPSELDRLVPGPDAAYAKAEPRPRPPRRRKGDLETATDRDLKAMPAALGKGGIATSALILARRIDASGSTDRDASSLHGQYRQHMNDLMAAAPGERKGDTTDQLRARREERMQQAAGD
jgi:hypothetical protein